MMYLAAASFALSFVNFCYLLLSQLWIPKLQWMGVLMGQLGSASHGTQPSLWAPCHGIPDIQTQLHLPILLISADPCFYSDKLKLSPCDSQGIQEC